MQDIDGKITKQPVFEEIAIAAKEHISPPRSQPALMKWRTIKRVDYATKEKRYVPVVAENQLRISFTTLTGAQNYAKRVLNRYILKLRVHNGSKNV